MNKFNRNVPIYCGAVDVGGTKIASALFTREGEVSAGEKIAVDKAGGDAAADQVRGEIVRLDEAACAAGGRLAAVGVCVPGIAYSASGKVWAPNIPGWDQYPLLEKIRGHKIPIVLESDRSAYVAGEAWRGAAAGARDAVFLAVGTGIGAGIISGGRLLHGHEDIAGAVGWFGLDPDFKPEYAAMGSFEAEASGNSVARKARAAIEKGRPSVLLDLAGGDIGAVTAETVAAAARARDPLALEIVAGAVSTWPWASPISSASSTPKWSFSAAASFRPPISSSSLSAANSSAGPSRSPRARSGSRPPPSGRMPASTAAGNSPGMPSKANNQGICTTGTYPRA